MKGYRINPDVEHVELIIQGLLKGNGFCPCKLAKTEENLCPCDEFISSGDCHCKLWVKEEEEDIGYIDDYDYREQEQELNDYILDTWEQGFF